MHIIKIALAKPSGQNKYLHNCRNNHTNTRATENIKKEFKETTWDWQHPNIYIQRTRLKRIKRKLDHSTHDLRRQETSKTEVTVKYLNLITSKINTLEWQRLSVWYPLPIIALLQMNHKYDRENTWCGPSK